MAENNQQKRKEENAETLKGVNYVYVNNTFLSFSNWDARFVFAERQPSGEVEPRVGIVMGFQQAKAFLEVFAATLQRIEATMGEIKYQPRDTANSDKKEDAHPPIRKIRLKE